MFERFTEEARRVVARAQEEARMLNHHYIGTEHLLLGLLREEEERGDEEERSLHRLGVTLTDAREKVVRIVGRGEQISSGQVPFTPRAKKVLELSLREALSLGQNWIGPDHILLGLARENEGVGSRVLLEFDADSEKIRNQVVRVLADQPPRPKGRQLMFSQPIRLPMDAAWFDGVAEVLASVAGEIRRELGRDPDVGDLLLVIACAGRTLGGEALHDLDVDLDALWGTLERVRQRRGEEQEGLMRKLDQIRAKKRQALEDEQFQEAARLRDEERELSAQLRSQDDPGREVLREVRRRLGLSGRGG